MFKLIDLYIARTLLTTISLTLGVLLGLSALIKFVDQLRKIGQGDYDMVVAGLYVLLSIPREVELFFPMATLVGGLIGMGLLAQTSELVIMQSSGMSKNKIVVSAMKSILVLIVLVIAMGQWVSPESEAKAKNLRSQALSGGSLLSSKSLTWAKDRNDFVSIGEVTDENTLQQLSIYKFNESLQLISIVTAEQALYKQENWLLQDVERMLFDDEQIITEQHDELEWTSTITPNKLGVVAIKPEALSITGLFEYVNYLNNNDQDSARYELALWRKLLQPLSVATMLLLALSFIFGPLRSVSMGARTWMGILSGICFFVSNELFGQAALAFQFPPLFGAILPSALFIALALFLIRRN